MTILTLTTDFGLADTYVGVMKGVILAIAPGVRLVDLTHEIPPQNVRQAVYALDTALPYFPADSIHVVVVDPGVGSQRRPIAARTRRGIFVGPDNGVFSKVLAADHDDALAAIVLDQDRYWLPHVSATFHGRDIFAPSAAHLAAGVPWELLGSPIDDPVILELPRPARLPGGAVEGQIVYVDRFGNLISNIPGGWLAGRQWRFFLASYEVTGPMPAYAAAERGQLLALLSSGNTLEIALREGNAAEQLNVHSGQPIHARPI